MTIPPRRSDRWSDRVEVGDDPATEFAGLYAAKAPESMARRVSYAPAVPERRKRVSAADLVEIRDRLSDRDRAIIRDIDRFGFVTTNQIQVVYFANHRNPQAASRLTRRTMQRLAHLRVVEPLARRIGGIRAGSAAVVWRIGPVGYRLSRADSGAPHPRFKEPSARFLDHRLAVADCYVQIRTLAHAGRLEVIRAEPEPISWRRFLTSGGAPELLKPDLYAVTAAGDYEDHWFCEVDRDTESLPTVIKKCTQYEHYRRTGREQHTIGLFPLVVWIAPSTDRAARIEQAIATSRQLDRQLYRVTTSAQFAALVGGAS